MRLSTQEWEGAVALVVEAGGKLARAELARVGALRDIKRDIAARRASLQKLIVQVPARKPHTPPRVPFRAVLHIWWLVRRVSCMQ